jgi:hypothetical protein
MIIRNTETESKVLTINQNKWTNWSMQGNIIFSAHRCIIIQQNKTLLRTTKGGLKEEREPNAKMNKLADHEVWRRDVKIWQTEGISRDRLGQEFDDDTEYVSHCPSLLKDERINRHLWLYNKEVYIWTSIYICDMKLAEQTRISELLPLESNKLQPAEVARQVWRHRGPQTLLHHRTIITKKIVYVEYTGQSDDGISDTHSTDLRKQHTTTRPPPPHQKANPDILWNCVSIKLYVTMKLRFSLFCDVTQRILVVIYRLSWQPIDRTFMGQAVQEECCLTL